MLNRYRDFHYGARLKQLLEKKGISVSDFALQMSSSRPSVYDWFNKKHFDDAFMEKLYKVVPISDEEFFSPVATNKPTKFIEERIEDLEDQIQALQKKLDELITAHSH